MKTPCIGLYSTAHLMRTSDRRWRCLSSSLFASTRQWGVRRPWKELAGILDGSNRNNVKGFSENFKKKEKPKLRTILQKKILLPIQKNMKKEKTSFFFRLTMHDYIYTQYMTMYTQFRIHMSSSNPPPPSPPSRNWWLPSPPLPPLKKLRVPEATHQLRKLILQLKVLRNTIKTLSLHLKSLLS